MESKIGQMVSEIENSDIEEKDKKLRKGVLTKTNWLRMCKEEIETIIYIDYIDEEIRISTNEKNTASRIYKKIGEPTHISNSLGKVCNAEWHIKFSELNILKKVFVLRIFITSFRNKK